MNWLFCILLAYSSSVPAEQATIVGDVRGKVGEQIALTAKADGKVRWVGLTPGLSFVPTDKLKNSNETFVCAALPGAYKVLAYTAKGDEPSEPVFVTVIVEPGPAPGPGPGPEPGPGPSPDPVKLQKLWVVIVEETADAVAGRGKLLADPALAARFKDKGHRWRVVDKDVIDSTGKVPADVARFLEAAKGRPYPQVFLVNERGQMVLSGDLPKDAAGLLALLQKAGG